MKKVLLALLAVLTLSTVSFAGWTPTGNVVPVDNGNPDFNTYIIGLSVDDANGITSVSDVVVTGSCVQYSKWDDDEEMWVSTPGPKSSTASSYLFDTRLLDLSSYGSGVTAAGDGWAEDNDGSLVDISTPTRRYGIGNLYLANDSSTLAINNPVAGRNQIDFLQFCVPTGQGAVVSGLYTNPIDADNGVPMVPFCFCLGAIPEPSTAVMLVLGTLCLLGIRRRK